MFGHPGRQGVQPRCALVGEAQWLECRPQRLHWTCGDRRGAGEPAEEIGPVARHRVRRCLLQQDLGRGHRPRIARVPPREIAAALRRPRFDRRSQPLDFFDIG